MTKKKLFIWTCDYSENTGEGKLARLFLKKLVKNKKFHVIFNQKKKLKSKYLPTLQGIFYCWKKFFMKEKVCYLNYLPLWNFLIFVFLPPKTILGPITGGANYSKSNILSYLIRRFFFPLFYKISEFSLSFRKSKLIFSTDLLKKYLLKKTIRKSNFNFVIKNFFLKKKFFKKKKIDFLIYYSKHKNKESFFPYDFLKRLIKLKFKIYVVGNKLNFPSVKNYGYISNEKILNLQSQSKYTIMSDENPYSFFILECLSNKVKVIVRKDLIKKFTFSKKNFIKLNFDSLNDINKIKKTK